MNKPDIKKYTKYAVAIIILLLLVIIRVIFISPETKITVTADSSSGGITVLNKNRIITSEIKGGFSGDSVTYSHDGTKCIFSVFINDGNAPYYSIYSVSKNKCRLICEKSTGDFLISGNGESVAYLDFSSKLCLYSLNSKSTKTVAQKCNTFAVSPDGKTIVYTSPDNAGLAEILYLYSDGKTTELSTELVPVAVTDRAETVYAQTPDGDTLYRLVSGNSEKIKILSSVNGKITFNNDLSQFTVANDTGTYFYYGDTNLKLLIKGQCAHPLSNTVNPLTTSESGVMLYEDSLLNRYYITEKDSENNCFSVYFTDSNGGKTLICENAEDINSSDNHETVCFLAENELFISKKGKADSIAKNVTKFDVLTDKTTAYTDKNGTLYRFTGKKSLKISENVLEFNFLNNGYLYYTNNKKSLFLNKNSNKSKLIYEKTACCTFPENGNHIFCFIENTDGTYNKYSSYGKEFINTGNNLKSYY